MEKNKREIKFRFWDKIEKVMRYPKNSFPDLDYLYFEDIKRAEWGDNEFVSLQFTGLLDKNGKEIYEGDILRRGGASVVKFGDFYAGGNNEYYNQYVKSSFYIEFKDGDVDALDDGEEVIGNIYENPNLLSENKE